jgi:predicted P-loop ATPase
MRKDNEKDAKKRVEIDENTDLNYKDAKSILEVELLKIAEFRFNAITRFPEIRYQRSGADWKRLDDYELNSIVRKMRSKQVKYASKTRIGELLESDFSPMVNPIQEYFMNLRPVSNGHIDRLLSTVTLAADPASCPFIEALFKKCGKKWMVGTVANLFIEDRCANQLCFILSGPQGTFKSTWIRNMCPPDLQAYYLEGALDPDNKDSILATTSNFIFNLDDYFAGITSRKINEFKGLLTKNTVKVRRAYARYAEELPKICSFIASSNEEQFLHDPTGNRRFLPFEIESIDIKGALKLDIDKVWAEAYQLFKDGFVYWLEKADQDQLMEYNQRFEVQSNEFEVLVTYFRPPNPNERADCDLTNAEVLAHLQTKTGIKLSTKKLGEALRKAGFVRKQKRRGGGRSWVYAAVYADEADIYVGRQSEPPGSSTLENTDNIKTS